MLFMLSACSSKLEMMPDWFLKVSETSRLESVENELYLIGLNETFKIDLQTGSKLSVNEKVQTTKTRDIGKTGKEKKLKRWKLTSGKTSYSLNEFFSLVDDCQLSLYKYWLEKTNENKIKIDYRMGESERFDVLDFRVIKNDLFIIKNPALGGDAYHLEKYNLK